MIEILAAPLFLFAFAPISFLIVKGAAGVFLAPVISAVVAVYGAMIHVLLDIPILWIWFATALIGNALVIGVPAAKHRASRNVLELKSQGEYWLLIVSSLAGLAALATTPPPLGWDARSMWFAIPSWLNGPSEQYLTAQLGGAQTGWPEYPFFGPASFVTLWQLMGVDENLWAASRLSGLLAISLGALAVAILITRLASSRVMWVKPVAMFGFLLSMFFVADGYINNGYQDVMQGAAIAAVLATVLGYNSNAKLSSFALLAISSLAAINVKQEGFWFTVAILLLGCIYWALKRDFWFFLALLPAVAGKVAWDVFGAIVQMPASGSTDGMFGRIPEFFQGDSVANQILQKVMGQWFPPLHLGLMALLLTAAVGLWITRLRFEAILMGLATLALFAIPVVTYALGSSRHSIDWWLGTSYTRITASFTISVFLTLVVLALLNAPISRPAPSPSTKIRNASKKSKRGR